MIAKLALDHHVVYTTESWVFITSWIVLLIRSQNPELSVSLVWGCEPLGKGMS